MRVLFLFVTLIVLAAGGSGQGTSHDVTVTSFVFGNRYCAQNSALGLTLSQITGNDSKDIPGPTGSCIDACKPDGDRFLIIIQDDKMISFKAKDTGPLKEFCGKKVVVTGKASPTDNEKVFLLEIESVKQFIEPERKKLIESAAQSPKFGEAADNWFEILKKKELGKATTAEADAAQKIAKDLTLSTADQAMWNLLRSYDFNMRRWFILTGLSVGDAAKVAALDAEWKPILEKCRSDAYRNLLLRAGPTDTECQRVASMK